MYFTKTKMKIVSSLITKVEITQMGTHVQGQDGGLILGSPFTDDRDLQYISDCVSLK